MNTMDRLAGVKGRISAKWVGSDGGIVTEYPVLDVHNTLSFTAADVMAAAYGGDTRRIPKYIGFIYGNNPAPSLGPINRDMDMESVKKMVELISGGANMQVARFSRKPTVGDYTAFGMDDEDPKPCQDSTESNDQVVPRYIGNIVEFHAITRSSRDGIYVNDVSENGPFAGRFEENMTIYRAVLLGDGLAPCEDDPYTLLAMVDLKKDGVYRQKPKSYELAIDWRVIFE